MANRMILNETSYFGWGAREVLIKEIFDRNLKKILVVSDSTLVELGVTSKVTSLLEENDIPYVLFDNVLANPTVANVKSGLKLCKKEHCDGVIAIGGGSVIDTAKAIAVIKTNPEFKDVVSLEGVSKTVNKALPVIVLPTTAGTAAEVTINYVITDTDRVVKMVCVDKNSIPVLSIIDTELMAAMPASLAAATGMDALTHAMECYITKGHWAMSDMYALQAIKMIFKNLEKAVNKDKDAIETMAMAQYIAGMGFSNAGLGIVHSMAHQLGAMYNTPHGLANALLLPYVLEWNSVVCLDRFKDMAVAMELNIKGLNDEQIANKVVNAVRSLGKRLSVPQHIKEVGGNINDIPALAKKALADPCTPGNPRETGLEDFERLFEQAF